VSFCIISQHFVLGFYFHHIPPSFAPPSLEERRWPSGYGGQAGTSPQRIILDPLLS
jgi:hypothetical protein